MRLKSFALIVPFFVGCMMVSFAATAFAAGAASPDDGSLLDLARPVYDQIMSGHFIAAAAFALVLAVALAKKMAPSGGKLEAFLHSDLGGAAATFLMAIGGALATATLGGAAWHWSMLWVSAGVAFTAAGGYALAKKLVAPYLVKLEAKLPPWAQLLMKPLMALLDYLFTKPDPIAAAEKAGEAAVQANPAKGAGTFTDVG